MLKLGLLLVMLHALHEAHSYHKIHKGWDIISPPRVRATRGSCLVVPCSYTFPPKDGLTISHFHALWKKGSMLVDAVNSKRFYPIHPDYEHRTRFMGFWWRNNCTWMLTNVRDSDAAHFYLRIELLHYTSYSFSIPDTEVQVVDAKSPDLLVSEAGAGGDKVAYCSVAHSCPYEPPTLTWNRNGLVLNKVQRLSDWQWMTYSVLHLRSQSSTQELRCTVKYDGGQTLYSTVQY